MSDFLQPLVGAVAVSFIVMSARDDDHEYEWLIFAALILVSFGWLSCGIPGIEF